MMSLFAHRRIRSWPVLPVFCFLLALFASANASAKSVPLVAKWGRFDQRFSSSVTYEYPLQQCQFTVTFTSPRGETFSIPGFWDGGRTWRVRFSPETPGHWTYRTSSSDPQNQRLNHQTGEFLCTSPTGPARFEQHGPVRVSHDQRHFECADGSPFFWLADAAWNAPRLSQSHDWLIYLQARAEQKFSAVEWAAAPGIDAEKHSAFSGNAKITIDPKYFQRLDDKIDLMNRAGMLSVIAPLRGNDDAIRDLPEDQAAALVRYMVARWGAYDVAWLLTFDAERSANWQRIGRGVFASVPHGPVIVFPAGSNYEDFRNEKWVDAFGFGVGQNMNDDSLISLLDSPLSNDWLRQPVRPFIDVLPPLENGLLTQSTQRVTADDSRRIAWWSLLMAPPAGTSYGAQDVANWNTTAQQKRPLWQISIFLPGAKQMANISDFFASTPQAWNLRPALRALASQPGRTSPHRFITAAETESKDLVIAYIPEDRTLELYLDALSPAPGIQWFNPRTAQRSPAVAVVGARTCQLPTPDQGDWLLVMKNGK